MAALEDHIRLLVIEDNPGDYVLIEEYLLEEAGQPVLRHTETLAETVDILQNGHSFDTILLDLSLPDASGQSLVERVVDLAGYTPVIVLTGYENQEYGLETLNLGVADYLLKDELNPFLLSKSISYSIERSKIIQSLRKSEQQYRNLFDLSPLPKWVYDVQTLQFLDVNQTAIDHYGYSREEFLSMTIRDIRPPEDIPRMEKALKKSLSTEGIHQSGVFRHKKKNGDHIQVEIKSSLISYNGRRAKMVVAKDVTDKIKAEQDLKVSEQKFKALVQEGADIISIIGPDGTYKFISPNHEQITGWTPEELKDKNVLEYIHAEDKDKVSQLVEGLESSDRIQLPPFRFRHKEGHWLWFESVGTNLTEEPAIQGYIINTNDITERKYYTDLERLERFILEMNALGEADIEKLVDEFVQGIEQIHPEGKCSILQVKNDKLYNLASPSLTPNYVESLNGLQIGPKAGTCGTAAYTNELVISENVFEDPRWAGLTDLAETYNFKACWSQPISNSDQEVVATFAVYYEESKTPSELELNTIKRAASILRVLFDSYEKEKADQQLALSEQRFRSLVQGGSDLIAILDTEGNYKYVAPTSEAILDIPAEEFIGTNALDYIHEENQERIATVLSSLADKERVEIDPFRFRDADGNWRWIETVITNMLDNPAVEGFVANSRDVTESMEREKKLRESLKEKETLLLEIHHRVKNNLAVVSGMMQLQAFQEDEERVRQKLYSCVSRIQTMGSIHELLYQSTSFSRLKLGENIKQLISNIIETYHQTVDLDIAFDLDPVILNINQAIPCSLIINEVVTNVLKHAFNDRESGILSVKLSERNGEVQIKIKDNGKGLPENFEHISKDNSLGLKLIDTLTSQLGGDYSYKPLDCGALFELTFRKADIKGAGNVLLGQ